MPLNDTQIIDNTRIQQEDDGTVTMFMPLPDGDVYKQRAQSKESAQKHIMKFCEAVRAYEQAKEEQRQEEILAAKKRRQQNVELPEKYKNDPEMVKAASPPDTKTQILIYFDDLQYEIDELGEKIEAMKERRNKLRDERDSIEPIIKVWRNHE